MPLLNSINKEIAKWTRVERRNFQIFLDQINLVLSSNRLTAAEKIVKVSEIIRFYERRDSQLEQRLLNIQIDGWERRLNDMCSCVGL